MQFRISVDLPPPALQLHPSSRVLLLGSCFSAHVGKRLGEALPRVVSNPMGVLYNPSSIASALDLLLSKEIPKGLLFEGRDGLWHSWAHSSEVSAPTKEACQAHIRKRWEEVDLTSTNALFVTFGTARIYELEDTGVAVANCHKELASRFRERELSVEEIVQQWETLLARLPADLSVVFTISPYRYAKYGMHESQLSKARLLLAVEQLCQRHAQCHYFPAYEIILDELRDYRFYAPDMLHPTAQASDYVWERLQEWLFPPATKAFAKERIALIRNLAHNPRDAQSMEHQQFLLQTQQKLEALDASIEK